MRGKDSSNTEFTDPDFRFDIKGLFGHTPTE